LFVPADNRSDISGVDQSVEEVVILDAGNAEQSVDPEIAKSIDCELCD
jgi:hypothetical protein